MYVYLSIHIHITESLCRTVEKHNIVNELCFKKINLGKNPTISTGNECLTSTKSSPEIPPLLPPEPSCGSNLMTMGIYSDYILEMFSASEKHHDI